MTSAQSPADVEDHPVARRIRRPGPKYLLALDGGGLRGVVALAFLQRIETLLRARYGNRPDFRLRDHFDMIGGTSSGAIIATGLALGHSVDDMLAVYRDFGRQVFVRHIWRRGLFGPRFSLRALEANFHRELGERTLGTREITCALVLVAKRLDTGSVWVLHNNPFGRYYGAPKDEPAATPNKDLPLQQILRASTAAPTFFPPEFIEVAKGHSGFFVDGGASPYNNPALLLFLVATTPSYGYGWQSGEQALHLTSVGTGLERPAHDVRELRHMPSALMATHALRSIVADCSRLGHMVLQSMAAVRTPWSIDREAGALDHEKPPERRLLSYARFDVPLESAWIERELRRHVSAAELAPLGEIDNVAAIEPLYQLGAAAAERLVRPDLLSFAAPPA